MPSEMEDLLNKYEETFGSLPHLPIMASYFMVKSLMEKAIKRGFPLTQEEINRRVSKYKYDIVR